MCYLNRNGIYGEVDSQINPRFIMRFRQSEISLEDGNPASKKANAAAVHQFLNKFM